MPPAPIFQKSVSDFEEYGDELGVESNDAPQAAPHARRHVANWHFSGGA